MVILNKKSIRELVYEQLQRQIMIGEIAPRSRIVEMDIAKTFGCSQAPIREALQKLQEDGLVELVPFTGAFVTEVSFDEIKELFEYRRLIEVNALQKSIHLLSRQDIHLLSEMVENMRNAGKQNDIAKIVSYDMLFHRSIIEKSGKRISLHIWSKLDLHVRRFIILGHPKYFDQLEEIADAHKPLIEALKKGDFEEAEKVFSQHINIDSILEKLKL